MVIDIFGYVVYSFDNRYFVYSFDECLKRRIFLFFEILLNWIISVLVRYLLIFGILIWMFYLLYNLLLF